MYSASAFGPASFHTCRVVQSPGRFNPEATIRFQPVKTNNQKLNPSQHEKANDQPIFNTYFGLHCKRLGL